MRYATIDTLIRYSTTLAVVGVATIAAVVSYQHAYAVVAAHGEDPTTARMVPLTVDGLVYASSMVLWQAARCGDRAPWWAWGLLVVGISATLAANVAHGAGHGAVGAVVAAWPAVALVGAYELLMWLVRTRAAAVEPADSEAPDTARQAGGRAATGPEQAVARTERSDGQAGRADLEATALAVLSASPNMSGAELGRRLGVSDRTGRRVRAHLAGEVGQAQLQVAEEDADGRTPQEDATTSP